MRIPSIWVRATRDAATAWGWSENSEEEALRMARERAERIAARLGRGETAELERYPYGADAIREWCVERYHDTAGRVVAAMTRNRYGAWVLNAESLMMADVDLPEVRPAGVGLIGRLFGRKAAPAPVGDPAEDALRELEAYLASRGRSGARVYRTPGGLRYLFAGAPAVADSEETLTALRSLGCDPLYLRLCRSQRCFRARLTAKPWRCGLSSARLSFPFADDRERQRFEQWDRRYEQASNGHAACRYLRTLGDPTIHPELAPLIELHDARCRATTDLPLA